VYIFTIYVSSTIFIISTDEARNILKISATSKF